MTFAALAENVISPGLEAAVVPGLCPRGESPTAPDFADDGLIRQSARVAIIDDEPINVKLVRKHLSIAGYRNFVTSQDPSAAVELLFAEQPDVLLLDIMMPRISGLEILQRLRNNPRTQTLPVLILTAADDEQTKVQALELGATDFLSKPVRPTELLPRVRNVLLVKTHQDQLQRYAEDLESQVRTRTAELAASRLELIHCLARAAEYRDNETGRHVLRVGRYVGIIARQLGLPSETCELLEHAAPLHDMGKIGIPDDILLKPGKLTPEEFEMMQRHTSFGKRTFEPMTYDEWRTFERHTFLGEKILEMGSSPILAIAGRIALTHHEKWDGTGYPLGLSGEMIPIEGRITAVADVFDALSSRRPYKPPLPLEECFRILEEGRAGHFDPEILDAFFARKDEIVKIRMLFADGG